MASDDLYRALVTELDPATPWDSDRDEHVYAALRAVVELHAPQQLFEGALVRCACGSDGYMAQDGAPWPCSTIRTIAEALGITEGDDRGQG